MRKLSFKIIEHGSHIYKEAVLLRGSILREPLGLTFLPEELELEKHHIHVVGFLGKEICATAVLVPENDICKMQRVVVNTELQAKGIGSEMMRFCEDIASKMNFQKIYCHARDSAVAFYLKNGYVAEGEPFEEDTIPHQRMYKIINIISKNP